MQHLIAQALELLAAQVELGCEIALKRAELLQEREDRGMAEHTRDGHGGLHRSRSHSELCRQTNKLADEFEILHRRFDENQQKLKGLVQEFAGFTAPVPSV